MKQLAKAASSHARFFKLAFLVLGAITTFGATANAAASTEGFPILRVDVGILAPRGLGMKTWGYGGSVEPKLMLTNAAAVGLRLEGAFHTGGSISDGKADVSTWASGALLAKGEYRLFPSNTIRPFFGLGMGVYYLENETVTAHANGATLAQGGGYHFGVAPQLGVEMGRFRLLVGYNAIFNADIAIKQRAPAGDMAMTVTKHLPRNYFILELGVRFGG